jgi:YD repeat-containing protein
MKRNEKVGAAGMVARLFTAFMLLMVAFGANATDCNSLYAATGAVPGSPTCRWDVYGRVPGGMANYACVNTWSLIDAWCAAPTADEPEASCPVADPVYPGNGAVTLSAADFVSGDDIPMRFMRTYRSKSVGGVATSMGAAWVHNWQRSLGLANANNGSESTVLAFRENGEPVTFKWSAGAWRTLGLTGLVLNQTGSGWTITDMRNETGESYSPQGVLLSESTKTGFIRSLFYDTSGLLTSITQHAAGTDASNDITLHLEYDEKRRLSRLNDPLGGMTQYGYDASDNLVSVTWPDGYARRYVYDDSRFKNALTGEIDESGNRVATWQYDSQKRVIEASHPESTHNVQFSYGTGTTSVTDSQRTTRLNFSSIGGTLRPTVSSTAEETKNLAWDAFGSLQTETDASGSHTYEYDVAGRPVRVTSENASGPLITSIRYADATSLHPSMIASPGVIQSFVYDAQGNTTGVSEIPTTDSTGASTFDAARSDATTTAYGMVYDAYSRLSFLQMYEAGKLIGQYRVTRDSTGNVFAIIAQQEISDATEVITRDAAHRAVLGYNPTGDFNLRYDRRGRIDLFKFNEYASPANGGVRRVFKVSYGYSPAGQVVSRVGTVARNGNLLDLNDGTDIAISNSEIDEWIDNYNFGESPVGPSANREGMHRMVGDNFLGTSTVCSGCHFSAGLPDGILRGILFVWRLAQNPAVRYGIGQGARKAADTIERVKEMCKPVVKETVEVDWGKNDNQIAHTFRHLEERNIPVEPVKDAIVADLEEAIAALPLREGQTRTVVVDGTAIDYGVYKTGDNSVRVGSIRPPR